MWQVLESILLAIEALKGGSRGVMLVIERGIDFGELGGGFAPRICCSQVRSNASRSTRSGCTQ